MMTPSKLDPMVGIGISENGMISDGSDNADLIDFCFLCSRQFFHENLDNYGTERFKDEDILETFFEELGPVERALLQCCPSCKKLCKTVTRTKEALSSLIEEITSLLLRSRKVSYLVSKSRVVNRLFQSSNSSLPPCETSSSYLQRPLSQINFVRDASIPSTNPSHSIPSEFDLRLDTSSLNVPNSFCLGLPDSSSAVSVIKKSPLCKKALEPSDNVRITRSATAFASIFNDSIMNSVSDNACDVLEVGGLPIASPRNCSATNNVEELEKCPYTLSNKLESLQKRPQIIQSGYRNKPIENKEIPNLLPIIPTPKNTETNLQISKPEVSNISENSSAPDELNSDAMYANTPDANDHFVPKRKSTRISSRNLKIHHTKLKMRIKLNNSTHISHTIVSPSPSLLNNIPELSTKKSTTFQCHICSKILRSARNLRDHLKIHQNQKKPFLCEICGAGYRRKSGLESHIAMHAGETKFRCNICSKFFTQKTGLERHLRIHSNKYQYQCDICGKNFLHHSSFNLHKQSHVGVKNYACTECDLTFLQSSHLQRHMIVHTGAKPYRCTMCNRSFSQNFNMKVHMQTHEHVPSIVFDCPKCPKSFTRKFKLKVHMNKAHEILLR